MTQLVDLLWGEIQNAMPDIPAHKDRCKEFLVQSLKGGASIQSAAKFLVKAFKGDKGILVDQDEVCRRLSGALWEQMRKAMPNITFIELACRAKLAEELKSGKSPEHAVKRLVKDIKSNPRGYMIMPSLPSFDSCRHCRGCCP